MLELLLLSNGKNESERLRRDLSFVGRCDIALVRLPFGPQQPVRVVISDVSFDGEAAVTQLRAAVKQYRSPGAAFVCLLSEQTHWAEYQALELGADKVLSAHGPRDELLDVAAAYLRPVADVCGMETSVRPQATTTALILSRLMDATTCGEKVDELALEKGSDAVLDALAINGIRQWLKVVWTYDDTTYQHSLLVAGLVASFSMTLSFPPEARRLLVKAALLHDIGKASIPLEILNKPSSLTAAELAVMRTHAELGYNHLQKQGGFPLELLQLVRSHHEVLDGSGYPDGLAGDEIPDAVRLMTICDIYAALIEQRPYKKPLDHKSAYLIMDEMGPKLDRALLRAFKQVMNKQNSGSYTNAL